MKNTITTTSEYIASLPHDRQEAMLKLQETINQNLLHGFTETMQYGMLSWVVPHNLYPAGYHCKPDEPLPFLAVSSQKNFIAIYHMGIYADKELHDWFIAEYPKHAKTKLDMGKSCIRFKKPENIPYELIGQLVAKTTQQQWIILYESAFRRKN